MLPYQDLDICRVKAKNLVPKCGRLRGVRSQWCNRLPRMGGWFTLRKLDMFYQEIGWNRDIMSRFLCPTVFDNGIQRNDE